MASTAIPIQTLIDMTNRRLSGYQNAVSSDQVLDSINDGVAEVWAILKSFNQEYFGHMSQSTDPTALDYFPNLVVNQREYTLPADFREINYIECTTQSYTQMRFEYKTPQDQSFRDERSLGDQLPGNSIPGQALGMAFTIVGKNTLVFAQYPPTTLAVTLWYIRSLPVYEADDTLDEILAPYYNKIADWACKKSYLEVQDMGQWQAWTQEWKSGVQTLAAGASPRNQANASFVEDFCG